MQDEARQRILLRLLRTCLIIMAASFLGVFRCILLPGGIPLTDPAAILGSSGESVAYPDSVSLNELLELTGKGANLLLDARSIFDYEEGHIPGAVSLPYEEFEDFHPDREESLAEFDLLLIYCTGRSCDLAERLSNLLARSYEGSIRIFRGGIEEWMETGFEVEEGF